MILNIIKKIFGTRNDRILKSYINILNKINSLDKYYTLLTDEEIKKKYYILKNNNILINQEEILINLFAIVREVSKRTLNMKHFDVQILGALTLYNEKIAEIATGEGKTLIATLPAIYYATINKKVHIATVNDYLAQRDAHWMMPIYQFLNLSVGIIIPEMTLDEKKTAYNANITYGTSSEFGFDYLRDNIVMLSNDKVQKELFYVIMDEVDSILIDEARTPLIISIPDKTNKNLYIQINNLIKNFKIQDNQIEFIIDEKNKQLHLTDIGFNKLELLLKNFNIIEKNENLYNIKNIELLHIIYASFKANYFFKKDIDYIIQNSEILIIDENTGRIMDGRRWGDGIHQAIEAKENLPIKNDNKVLATITFQNYFRLYKKKAGMTGTAYTESIEFENIYGLEVIILPPNKKCIRKDLSDIVFTTKKKKFDIILNDIKKNNIIGRPILVGTTSIKTSEFLSNLLKNNNIKHNVLNAKNHAKESNIIANAGDLYSVTIATNMAGRGTDIILGGNNKKNHEQVIKLGGLKVIGVERHEARRIDNQLRGRSGRQGDPGESQFYLSLEDDLIKIFVGEKTKNILTKIKISDDNIISHPLVTNMIHNAQKKIEQHNFDIRKQLLEYDDITNEQRHVFYNYRNLILFTNNINYIFKDLIIDIVTNLYISLKENYNDNKITLELIQNINKIFKFDIIVSNKKFKNINNIQKYIYIYLYKEYIKKKINLKKNNQNLQLLKTLFLITLDTKWTDHLINLEIIKAGIHLRGYAQKDPKIEYKKEAFLLFDDMLNNVKLDFIINFYNINITTENIKTNNETIIKNHQKKIGRNELCFCNSNKKYKYCHGKN